MSAPRIRKMLDLSTAHLRPDRRYSYEGSAAWGGAVVHQITYGFLMWVPDDPVESAKGASDPVPSELLVIQGYARRKGCDYVLFDADAEVNDELRTFDDDADNGDPNEDDGEREACDGCGESFNAKESGDDDLCVKCADDPVSCPVEDPDCIGGDGDCHDACEAPKVPRG